MNLKELVALAETTFGYKLDWHSRTIHNAAMKQAVWWALRNTGLHIYREIGMMTGGFDHSTVLHGCKSAEKAIASGIPVWQEWRKLTVGMAPTRAESANVMAAHKTTIASALDSYVDLETGELVEIIIKRTPGKSMCDVLADWKATGHSVCGKKLYLVRR